MNTGSITILIIWWKRPKQTMHLGAMLKTGIIQDGNAVLFSVFCLKINIFHILFLKRNRCKIEPEKHPKILSTCFSWSNWSSIKLLHHICLIIIKFTTGLLFIMVMCHMCSLKSMFDSPQFMEALSSFQHLLLEGIFDLSFSEVKIEECRTVKRLALVNMTKSKWVEHYELLKVFTDYPCLWIF